MLSTIVTLDLEGVLVPEIWIAVAEKTGIPELRLTTRDIQNYDELMAYRLKILDARGLTLSLIQDVIGSLEPLNGAREFLDKLRRHTQVIILSDTFSQFGSPLMAKLSYPTLFCHHLITENDRITGYKLRQQDQKRQAVLALKSLNYKIIAAGDSYNDTTMLGAADVGFLFHAPENIEKEFPQFPSVHTYAELETLIYAQL